MPPPRRRFDAVLEEKTGIRLVVDNNQSRAPAIKQSNVNRPIVSFASVPSRGSARSHTTETSVIAATSFLTPRRVQQRSDDDDLILEPFASSDTSRSPTPSSSPPPTFGQDQMPSFATLEDDTTKETNDQRAQGAATPTGSHRATAAVLEALQASLDRLVTASMARGDLERALQVLAANRLDAGDDDGRPEETVRRHELSEKITALQCLDPSEVKLCLAGNPTSGEVYEDQWSSVRSDAEREALRLVVAHFPTDGNQDAQLAEDGVVPCDEEQRNYVVDHESGTLIEVWTHRAAGRYYMAMLKGLAVARSELLLPTFVAIPFAVSVASGGRYVTVTWLPPLRSKVPRHVCAPQCPPSIAATHSASFCGAISEMLATYMQWHPRTSPGNAVADDGEGEGGDVHAVPPPLPPPWSLFPGHDDRIYIIPSHRMLCHHSSTVARLADTNVFERYEYVPLDNFPVHSDSNREQSTSTPSRVEQAIKERLLPLLSRNVAGLCKLGQTSDTQWLSRYFHTCGVGVKCILMVHRALGLPSMCVEARHRPFVEQLRALMVSEVLARALKTLILRHVRQLNGGPSSKSVSFLGASATVGNASGSNGSSTVGGSPIRLQDGDSGGGVNTQDSTPVTSPTAPMVASAAPGNTTHWKTFATAVKTVARLDTEVVRPALGEGGANLVAAVATEFLKKMLRNRRFLSKTVLSHIFRKYDGAHDLVLDLEVISTPLIVRHLEARLGLLYDTASRSFGVRSVPVVLQSAGRNAMDVASITNDAAMLADRIVSMGSSSTARCTAAATVARVSLYYALVAIQNTVPGAENVFAGAVGRAAMLVKMLARHPTRQHEHILLMLCLGRLGLNTTLMYRALGAAVSLDAPALHLNPEEAAVCDATVVSVVDAAPSSDPVRALDGFVLHSILEQSLGIVDRLSDKGQHCSRDHLLGVLLRQWCFTVCSALRNVGIDTRCATTPPSPLPDVLDAFSLGALRQLTHRLLATAPGSRVRKDPTCAAVVEQLLALTAWCALPLQHAETVMHNIAATRLLPPPPQSPQGEGGHWATGSPESVAVERLVLRLAMHATFDSTWPVAAVALLPTRLGEPPLSGDHPLAKGLLTVLDADDDGGSLTLCDVPGMDNALQQADRLVAATDCARCFTSDAQLLVTQLPSAYCRAVWRCRTTEQQVVALLPVLENGAAYVAWLLSRRIRAEMEQGSLVADAQTQRQLLDKEEDSIRCQRATEAREEVLALKAALDERNRDQGIAIVQKVHREAVHKKAMARVDDVAKSSLTTARTTIAVKEAHQRKEEHMRQVAMQRSMVDDEANGRQAIHREEATAQRALVSSIWQHSEELGIAIVQKVHREAVHKKAMARVDDVAKSSLTTARANIVERAAQSERTAVLESIMKRMSDRRREAGERMAAEFAHAKAAAVYQHRQDLERGKALAVQKQQHEAALLQERTAALAAMHVQRSERIKARGAALASQVAAGMVARARQRTADAMSHPNLLSSSPVIDGTRTGDEPLITCGAMTTKPTQLDATGNDVEAAQLENVQPPSADVGHRDSGEARDHRPSDDACSADTELRVGSFEAVADAEGDVHHVQSAVADTELPHALPVFNVPAPSAAPAMHVAAVHAVAERLPNVMCSVQKCLDALSRDAIATSSPRVAPSPSAPDRTMDAEVYAVEKAKHHTMQSIRQQGTAAHKTAEPADVALVLHLVRTAWASSAIVDPPWGSVVPPPCAPHGADFSLRSPLHRGPTKGNCSELQHSRGPKKACMPVRSTNAHNKTPTSPDRKPLRLTPLITAADVDGHSEHLGSPLDASLPGSGSCTVRPTTVVDQMHLLHAAVLGLARSHHRIAPLAPAPDALASATTELAELLTTLAPWYAPLMCASIETDWQRGGLLFLRDVVCYEAKREQVLLLLVSLPRSVPTPLKGVAPTSPSRARNTMRQVMAECCASCVRAHQLHRMAYVLHLRSVAACVSASCGGVEQGILSSLRALQWGLLLAHSMVAWQATMLDRTTGASTTAAAIDNVPLLLALQDASARGINLGDSTLPETQRLLQSPAFTALAAFAKASVRTTAPDDALLVAAGEAPVVAAESGTAPFEAWLTANDALLILDAFALLHRHHHRGTTSDAAVSPSGAMEWLSALLLDVLGGLAAAFELRQNYQASVFAHRLRAQFTTTAFGDHHSLSLAAHDAANDRVRRELAFVQEVSQKRLDKTILPR